MPKRQAFLRNYEAAFGLDPLPRPKGLIDSTVQPPNPNAVGYMSALCVLGRCRSPYPVSRADLERCGIGQALASLRFIVFCGHF